MLPHFAQSLGDAPLLRSVPGGTLPCFAQSLGGCSLASLSCWGDAPSLRSVTGGLLPRFAQLLGGRSLALLSHWGDAPSLRSVTGGRSVAAGLNPLLGPSYSKVGSYPLIKEGLLSLKNAFLRANRATLLR